MSTRRQTAQLKQAFLAAFREHGNVSKAAASAGVDRPAVYKWRERDATFAAAFLEAEIEATEHLEAEAHRRAVEGVREPVFWRGEECGAVRKYSDTLLMFLLKARAPQKYRERYEVSGEAGGPLVIRYVNDWRAPADAPSPPDESA